MLCSGVSSTAETARRVCAAKRNATHRGIGGVDIPITFRERIPFPDIHMRSPPPIASSPHRPSFPRSARSEPLRARCGRLPEPTNRCHRQKSGIGRDGLLHVRRPDRKPKESNAKRRTPRSASLPDIPSNGSEYGRCRKTRRESTQELGTLKLRTVGQRFFPILRPPASHAFLRLCAIQSLHPRVAQTTRCLGAEGTRGRLAKSACSPSHPPTLFLDVDEGYQILRS